MNPRVKKVIANDDFTLTIIFVSGEKKNFNVKPYLNKGIFVQLRDKQYFKRVKIENGTISWPNGQDFCPDTLYENSGLEA